MVHNSLCRSQTVALWWCFLIKWHTHKNEGEDTALGEEAGGANPLRKWQNAEIKPRAERGGPQKELSKHTHGLRQEHDWKAKPRLGEDPVSKRGWAIQLSVSSLARNMIPRLSRVTRTARGINWRECRVQAKSVHRPCRQDERLQASEPLPLSEKLKPGWVPGIWARQEHRLLLENGFGIYSMNAASLSAMSWKAFCAHVWKLTTKWHYPRFIF